MAGRRHNVVDSTPLACEHISVRRGRPSLARKIRKEIAVSFLALCGVVSTAGIGYLLHHWSLPRGLFSTGDEHFVTLVILGLAFSLVAAASTEIRARDTVILILAATIVWSIFVEPRSVTGMVRFVVFATLITAGVALAGRLLAGSRARIRIGMGAVLPGIMCGVAGLVFHGAVARLTDSATGLARNVVIGGLWGLALGLAVGLGLAFGREALHWMSKDVS